jgi:thioredoxin 1
MHELQSAEELNVALKSNKFNVVKFYTQSCVPCKILAPVIEKISTDPRFKDVVFTKYNVEVAGNIDSLNIYGVPTIIIFVDGKEISRTRGMTTQRALESVIQTVVSNFSKGGG